MCAVVMTLKQEKRIAKSSLTRSLNQVVVLLSEETFGKKLREESIRILDELESIYSKIKDNETERKPGGKAMSMVLRN